MEFTWDSKKADKVLADHGVDFSKIADIFEDSVSLDLIDKKHSTPDDKRFIIVGMTAKYGLIHLVYSMPCDDEIHFITARKADKWHTIQYEENVRGT